MSKIKKICLNSSLDFGIINVQIHFLGAIVIGAGIGHLIWRARYKPMRDEALKLIREIESDN